MSYTKVVSAAIVSAILILGGARHWQQPLVAQPEAKYVGADKCKLCHADVSKTWMLTQHRRTLYNTDPAKQGCEGCHGPGAAHAESGDKADILVPNKLKPEQTAAICLKCHTQEHITLWKTGRHARAKLSCTSCHDSHNPDPKTLAKDIENGKLSLEALTSQIKQLELKSNGAKAGSKEQVEAQDKFTALKTQRDSLLDKVKGAETVYRRSAEPYMCFNCHKPQQVQSKMPYHHPIEEGKMKCTDCHNPHGGPNGMLREESVNDTCFRCHAEKEGPFTYEHPPVAEDCTACHTPHGSVQNDLLTQSEPFLCLRCHAGPHSRRSTLASAKSTANYYSQCTSCHAGVHGSDQHPGLHY